MRTGLATRPHRPVTVTQIAEAAAMGNLAAALSVLTRLVPAEGVGVLLAAFPLAVLAHRRRARVSAIGVMTAFTVAFLGGGLDSAASAATDGALGSLVGSGCGGAGRCRGSSARGCWCSACPAR